MLAIGANLTTEEYLQLRIDLATWTKEKIDHQDEQIKKDKIISKLENQIESRKIKIKKLKAALIIQSFIKRERD